MAFRRGPRLTGALPEAFADAGPPFESLWKALKGRVQVHLRALEGDPHLRLRPSPLQKLLSGFRGPLGGLVRWRAAGRAAGGQPRVLRQTGGEVLRPEVGALGQPSQGL